jgi:hypothetical protein
VTAAGSLFERDGDRIVPTALTAGPWDRAAQHGGAPAALLAHVLGELPSPVPMRIARLTVELLRPVPVAPLAIETSVVREGKRVQLASASLSAGGLEVARAVALRMRTRALAVPPPRTTIARPPGPAEGATSQPPWSAAADYVSYHRDAVEHRFVVGSFAEPGPATDWIRLRVPLFPGVEPSPTARVAAVADFGNGIAWELSRADGWSFINPDLTIHLARLPVGPWICLEAVTHAGPDGMGVAESRLFDEHGPIGRSLQSLLLDRSG